MVKINSDTSSLYHRVLDLAKQMRRQSTKAEQHFWVKARNRQIMGYKFRRQHVIECKIDYSFTKYYIADFYCASKRVIIELDGGIHEQLKDEDFIRTETLSNWGYKILRFTNSQVLNHWDEVESQIINYLSQNGT